MNRQKLLFGKLLQRLRQGKPAVEVECNSADDVVANVAHRLRAHYDVLPPEELDRLLAVVIPALRQVLGDMENCSDMVIRLMVNRDGSVMIETHGHVVTVEHEVASDGPPRGTVH